MRFFSIQRLKCTVPIGGPKPVLKNFVAMPDAADISLIRQKMQALVCVDCEVYWDRA